MQNSLVGQIATKNPKEAFFLFLVMNGISDRYFEAQLARIRITKPIKSPIDLADDRSHATGQSGFSYLHTVVFGRPQ